MVEAGALAHDIGNPPFGHSGERKLHELFEHAGGLSLIHISEPTRP